MARVPEGLAREALEWLADEANVISYSLDAITPICRFCEERDFGDGNGIDHAAYCLHTRSAEWLAAEKAAREWEPKAVEVCPVHDYTLPCPSCDMAAGVVS